MSEKVKPRILIVDDQPETIPALIFDRLEITIREPGEVYDSDLRGVDLVLVDYEIDRFPARDALDSVPLRPLDGVAVAAVLRSHFGRTTASRPVAIALHAANLDQLGGGLSARSREHIVARTHNLEWAFLKTQTDSGAPREEQLRSLASAITRLPPAWPQDEPSKMQDLVDRLLAAPKDQEWWENSWQDFEDCQPPIHELATATHGLAFIRWILHRILPYPTFLYDDRYLALQLRVTVDSLRSALHEEDEHLNGILEPIAYSGILSGFLGRRWWKAGVESLIWHLTDGKPFNHQVLAEKVTSTLSARLEPIQISHPVICVGERLLPTEQIIDRDQSVEIQPDDWPKYAQRPWVPIELAREDAVIGALVIKEDRDRLTDVQSGSTGE